MRTPIAVFATVALSVVISQGTAAHQAGDIVIRAGAATVDPNEDSGQVSLAGVGNTSMTVGADSNTQLGLTGTYMLTDHVGIGLLAATPFEHTLELKNSPDNGSLANIKHLPPTLTLQYYFSPNTNIQPYVGAGINYTTFFDEEFTSKHKAQGYNSLKLKDSWGVALEAGIDYQLTDNLLVNASIWYIDIDTEASFKVGNTKAKADVELDPWVYMVGLGYKF